VGRYDPADGLNVVMDGISSLVSMASHFNVDWAILIIKGSVEKKRFEMEHVRY